MQRIGIVVWCSLVSLLFALVPHGARQARAQSASTSTPTITVGATSTVLPSPTATATATNVPTATSAPTETPEPTVTREPTATRAPTSVPTATPKANARPDGCERNNRREQACGIAADAVNGPYTFLPDGDQNWYRVDLGEAIGLETTVTVRTSTDADVVTSVSREDGAPITSFSTPTLSTTLAADISGTVVLHVENRSLEEAPGMSYNIEVRRTLPPTPNAPAADAPTLPPDRLENNWNPATAAPIGVGVMYDLNFVCPVTWANACPGGDMDYLRLPVKAGRSYLVATFDLGPGVDTVLDLFWGSEEVPVATNDDVRPQRSFLSVLHWTAPSDGEAIIRVAPRTGGLNPVVFDDKRSSYRVVWALEGSDLAQQVEARIDEQSGEPTPIATTHPVEAAPVSGSAPPAAPPMSAAPAPPIAPAPNAPTFSDGDTGPAIVVVDSTVLRLDPNAQGEPLVPLKRDTVVRRLGAVNRAWVRVQPQDGVVPGWVYGTDLRALPTDALTSSTTPVPTTSAPGLPGAVPSPTPTAQATPQVTKLAPLILAPDVPAPHSTLAVTVTLVRAQSAAEITKEQPAMPLAGVRVQLVDTFGDVLTEQLTEANGTVRFARDLPDGEVARIQLPAVGLVVPIDPTKPTLTIALPIGGSP